MLIESQRLNEYSFSRRIGKSNTAVTKLVKGESKPGFDMLEAIFAEFPTLSREWFVEGVGEMWKPAPPTSPAAAAIPADNYLQEYMTRLENQFKSVLAEKQSIIEDLKSVIQYQRELMGKPERGPFRQVWIADLEDEKQAA